MEATKLRAELEGKEERGGLVGVEVHAGEKEGHLR
jgi:hypothetical protein